MSKKGDDLDALAAEFDAALAAASDDAVEKVNPNHDERGRFSEGPGGGGGGRTKDPPGYSSAMSGKSSDELVWIVQRSIDHLNNPRAGRKTLAQARDMGPRALAELKARAAARKSAAPAFVKADVAKVDAELGLVFGWGIICKLDGEPYFDSQRDHIPEDTMLRVTADFMENSRMSGDMHARDPSGEPVPDGGVVFSFPLTTEVAKAMGIETSKTGWLVAVRPSPEVLAKYKNGTYRGFSIGGSRLEDEDA